MRGSIRSMRPRATAARLRRVAIAAGALVAALAAPGAASAEVKIYLLQGEQLVAVNRPGSTVEDAVGALLKGATRAEATQRQMRSAIQRSTPVHRVAVTGDLATVDFGRRLAFGNDAEELTSRLTQVVYTVTAVPGIKRVRVLVEGGFPLGLFPGINAIDPLTRDRVATPTVPAPGETPDGGLPNPGIMPVQQRLIELGFLPTGSANGVLGNATRNAIVAFQKWSRLSRDGVVGPATTAALADATRPQPVSQGDVRRIEVLLDRQVALLIDAGRVSRVINISTGAPGFATPAGRYRVFRREEQSWSVPFQVWLPWAAYFVGGIAFHEYPDVPPSPASHGCVRVPAGDAERVFRFATMDTQVIVLETS